jgi:hypothetical protein
VHLSAPEEILFAADGSSPGSNENGIEYRIPSPFVAHSDHHSFVGQNSRPFLAPVLPDEARFDDGLIPPCVGPCKAQVTGPRLSNDDTARIGEVLYHETRHVEQRFLIARRQAAEGLDAEALAQSLGLKKKISEGARQRPLDRSDSRRSCADGLQARQYGAGHAQG